MLRFYHLFIQFDINGGLSIKNSLIKYEVSANFFLESIEPMSCSKILNIYFIIILSFSIISNL